MGRIGLDSNVFLCLLLPEATKTSQENVNGAEKILRSLNEENQGITSAIVFAEIAWAFLRENKRGPEMEGAKSVVVGMKGLEIKPVNTDIAWQAGKLRGKYYSKKRQISYQDAIYLATSIREKADVLYSSDPHLLELKEEIPVIEPKDF